MDLRLYTWNGIAINDGTTYTAYFPPGQKFNLAANPVVVPRADEFPFLSTRQLVGSTLVFYVTLVAGQSINTNRELVKKYFSVLDSTRRNLIARDAADSNREWYVTGFPTRLVEIDDVTYSITLTLEVPYWKLNTAGDTTWSVTASGQTQAVTNLGNIPVPPKLTLTPTVTKTGGLSYRRWVAIYNNLDVSFNQPIDITDRNATGGGLDTDALTTAKMQADGDDLRVMVDGVEVDRWLQGMDTTTTQVWINLNISPRHEGTLKTTLASATADITVEFSVNRANLATLQWMKGASNPIFLIESEAFQYDPDNVNLVTYKITSCKREARGTTAAGHTAGVTIRHIEHDVYILYGDSTLTAPDVNDDNKPLFDLDSRNDTWNWTNFFDDGVSRPGGWKGEKIASKTDLSYLYTGDSNAFADPSTQLGMAMIGSQMDYDVLSEVATLAWILSHPAGITGATFSGSKYYTSSWPAIAGIQILRPGAAWFTLDTQTAPSTAYAWEDFGPTTVSATSPYPTSIRFAMDGALSPITDEVALTQFDTVITTHDTASLPTISVGAEQTVNYFDVTITNNTSGEYIKCAAACKVNETVTIDCENKEAYASDGSRVNVVLSTDRKDWLNLASGSNTLQYDDTGTNAVTVHVIHRDRSL